MGPVAMKDDSRHSMIRLCNVSRIYNSDAPCRPKYPIMESIYYYVYPMVRCCLCELYATPQTEWSTQLRRCLDDDDAAARTGIAAHIPPPVAPQRAPLRGV